MERIIIRSQNGEHQQVYSTILLAFRVEKKFQSAHRKLKKKKAEKKKESQKDIVQGKQGKGTSLRYLQPCLLSILACIQGTQSIPVDETASLCFHPQKAMLLQ